MGSVESTTNTLFVVISGSLGFYGWRTSCYYDHVCFFSVIKNSDRSVILELTTISEICNFKFYVESKEKDEIFYQEIPECLITGTGTTLSS